MNVVEDRRGCVWFVGSVVSCRANVCYYSRVGGEVSEEWHEREPVEMRTFGSLLSSLVPSLSTSQAAGDYY